MTPEEQEYESRKYISLHLTILPFDDGRFAVGSGFLERRFTGVFTEEEFLVWLRAQPLSEGARPPPPVEDLLPDFDIEI